MSWRWKLARLPRRFPKNFSHWGVWEQSSTSQQIRLTFPEVPTNSQEKMRTVLGYSDFIWISLSLCESRRWLPFYTLSASITEAKHPIFCQPIAQLAPTSRARSPKLVVEAVHVVRMLPPSPMYRKSWICSETSMMRTCLATQNLMCKFTAP